MTRLPLSGPAAQAPDAPATPAQAARPLGGTAVRLPVLGLACLLLLPGCWPAGSGSDSTLTVTIGLDAPLSGELAELGQGVRHSADLAIARANEKKTVPGVRFRLDARDDRADDQVARTNGEAFAADPDVVGVVGPLTSSSALTMAPVLARAGLAEISPSNTAPALTWGPDYRANGKKRQYATYFRTVTTDAVQGPLIARYARSKLNAAKAAVVSDTKVYGANLAAEFAGAFEAAGGKVVLKATVEPGATDHTKLVAQIAAAKPDIVYFGGQHPEGGPLSAQLKAAGVKVPVAGGDGLHTDGYVKAAGAGANGDIASQPGISVEGLASAQTYLDAYRVAGHPEEPGPFGAYAYDSTWALIEAVGRARHGEGSKPTGDQLRKAVAEALQQVNFFGVTGDVSFDEFGDTRNQMSSIHQVQGGSWKPVVPLARLRDF
ncbi:branched-chain amino acid ABC transporter substrate-binding protein [Kitasatospora sp. NPDC054939]